MTSKRIPRLVLALITVMVLPAAAMEISVQVQDAGTTDPIEAAYVRYIFNPGTAAEDTVDGYTDATGGLFITHDLVSSVNDIPGFAVSMPYPNPAGSTAYFDVQGSDKAASALSFTLYDLRGRLVGKGEVGSGAVVLDHPLASGSYLYRLKSGPSVMATGKLVVLGRLERVEFKSRAISGSTKSGADPVDILIQATGYEDHEESQLLADGNHYMTFNISLETGTITIDSEPDSISGGWQLLGPGGLAIAGSRDTTMADMTPGEYYITWQPVQNWISPISTSRTLYAGGQLYFLGEYVNNNPFDGLTFGSDSTFEVMTWNLQHFPKNGTVTVQYAIQIIESLEIDIIALQEIENSTYFNMLRDSLEGWDGIRATGAAYDMNLAYLYRIDSDLQIDSVYEILSEYSREFPRRPFVLEGSYKGSPIVVINNHYKCCGDGIIQEDYWDEEARRQDASLMLDDFIRANYPDKAVMVAGDFNDQLTVAPPNNVFQNFIDASDTYRFVDLQIAQDPEELWSYPTWPAHLDHILITHQLFSAIEGDEALVEVSPLHDYLEQGWSHYYQDLSDHLPVLMKIAWP